MQRLGTDVQELLCMFCINLYCLAHFVQVDMDGKFRVSDSEIISAAIVTVTGSVHHRNGAAAQASLRPWDTVMGGIWGEGVTVI